MRTARISFIVILILTVLSFIVYFAYRESKTLKRDIPTLLNHYYELKNTSPWEAKAALELILQQDPDNLVAIEGLAYWYLQHGDTHTALSFLQQKHHRFPNNDTITYELAKLYLLLNQPKAAEPLLQAIGKTKGSKYQKASWKLYTAINAKQKLYKTLVNQGVLIKNTSYIEPIFFKESPLLAPLYQQAQEMSKLRPNLSRQYLKLILSINPEEYEAYNRLGYLNLNEGKLQAALDDFKKAFSLKPQASTAIQIGYIFVKLQQPQKARFYFKYGFEHGQAVEKNMALQALNYLTRLHELQNTEFLPEALSLKDQLLMVFYENKEKHPIKAEHAIKRLLRLYPHDLRIWKEASFYAIAQKKYNLAKTYLLHLYNLNPTPEYALQLGYVYQNLNNPFQAFRYFNRASKTANLNTKLKAEQAMTNIGPAYTKILPDPYFVEVYLAPFYFSRFAFGVLPSIERAGIVLNKQYETELYQSFRRTKDNRSGTIEDAVIETSISQIFEDNVAIYSIGLRSRLWPKIPLVAFLEVGRAEDLIYRDRPKWRDDVRGGLVYYNQWGAKPTYTSTLEFPFEYVATLYADTIYYSRYDNNIIGTAWFRPGFRVATFQSALLDVYLANFLVLDKNHDFFNNVYSLGPGVVFQPSNRINLKVRYESHQAFYIPVNSPTPNPFGSKYYNNIVMLEGFVRF